MSHLAVVKPKTAVEKRTSTTLETMMLTPEMIEKEFRVPVGQRPRKENAKVRAVADKIKDDGGVIPGILTLARLDGVWYIVDGQHRIYAFQLTGMKEGYADVRMMHNVTMEEIMQEFIELNSKLVSMTPDDFLRASEVSVPAIERIRKECPFIGYDMIRRGPTSPILSMSMFIRAWHGSSADAPVFGPIKALDIIKTLPESDLSSMIEFAKIAIAAWGRDPEYRTLWSGANLILCMWLYRRLVLAPYSVKTTLISKDTFKASLMELSANSDYVSWMRGRRAGDMDRSPIYGRIRTMFARRITEETGKKVSLPAPAWWSRASGS